MLLDAGGKARVCALVEPDCNLRPPTLVERLRFDHGLTGLQLPAEFGWS